MLSENAWLEAARRLLFFSQSEAAELIARVSDRAWRRWESGERPIPSDVDAKIRTLLAWREQEIKRLRAEIDASDGETNFVWHPTLESWISAGGEPVLYRPTQSAIAEVGTGILSKEREMKPGDARIKVSELIEKLMSRGEIHAATSLTKAANGKPDRDYSSIEELCNAVYRTEVIPGVDSYGITPAETMKGFLSAFLESRGMHP
jgi:hypothetical protein